MAFKDLGEWATEGLALPINGKLYQLPPVDAELGPQLQSMFAVGIAVATGSQAGDKDTEVLSDLAEQDLYQRVLGDAYAQMIKDGIKWAAIKLAAMTSMIDATFGREMAEQYWESKGKPQGRKAAPTTKTKRRKGTARKTSSGSTAGTTRS